MMLFVWKFKVSVKRLAVFKDLSLVLIRLVDIFSVCSVLEAVAELALRSLCFKERCSVTFE